MTRKESNIVKGLAIIMMLLHHLYYKPKSFNNYSIDFGVFGVQSIVNIAVFFKICVAIFVFISAYGLTKQYKEKKIIENGKISYDCINRYVKLIINYLCIYLLAILFSISLNKHTLYSVYGNDGLINAMKYVLIDVLGLARIFNTPTFNST